MKYEKLTWRKMSWGERFVNLFFYGMITLSVIFALSIPYIIYRAIKEETQGLVYLGSNHLPDNGTEVKIYRNGSHYIYVVEDKKVTTDNFRSGKVSHTNATVEDIK